jgi:macrolide transport system ATP-binding/permease protein
MEQPLLVMHNVSRVFQSGNEKLSVLNNIDLTIYDGEMVAIVGPSGCGKTTLLNILGCLDRPTSGSYSIAKQNTTGLKSDQLAQLRREYFGFIFQRYYLLNKLTAVENVELPAMYLGIEKKQRKERAHKLLIQLGLKDRVDFLPSQLSGGQQQRVSIARALMNGGKIILADEPTGALDSKHGAEVMQILHQLHQVGHTVIIVTHDLELARHADRIIELKDGILIKDTNYKNVCQDAQIPNTLQKDIPLLKTRHGHDFNEVYKTAFASILAHRMRSFLTMLGIIIGIASVVCVVALGNGAKEDIAKKFAAFGLKTIHVRSDPSTKNTYPTFPLTLADVSLFAQQPLIDSVSPEVTSEVLLHRGTIEAKAMLKGVGEQYYRVRDAASPTGEFFSKADILNGASLAVIDRNTQDMFFKDNESPIGQTIFVKGVSFKIIGIDQTPPGRFADPTVLIPYSTAISRISNRDTIDNFAFRPRDNVSSGAAESAVRKVLLSRHRKEDFSFMRANDLIEAVSGIIGTVALVISAIAFISLVVGGIGIMNIMLVSVTERTHEIGIRIAIGARKKDILQQFLIEAILICLIGGLVGILLAFAIGAIFNQFMSGFQMSFSVFSIILACIFSTLVGVFFGFVPAKNAAQLDPAVTLTGG